jgi:hypothetical protein
MERQVRQLPLPPSTAKEQFLERMKEEGGRMNKAILIPIHPSAFLLHPFKKERGLRKLSVAFALAASLLIFALAWWMWPHKPVTSPDLVQIEQAKLEQRLSKSLRVDTAKERVLRLTKLAEEVHGEARAFADQSEKLEQWARFFAQVVGEHLIEQARQLKPEERPAVLTKVAERLRDMESQSSRDAARLKNASPRSAAVFQQIAHVSQKGEQDLRALANG